MTNHEVLCNLFELGGWTLNVQHKEALTIAMAVMKKQSPVKPTAEYEDDGSLEVSCRLCRQIFDHRVNFCETCGQAVSWNEGEE